MPRVERNPKRVEHKIALTEDERNLLEQGHGITVSLHDPHDEHHMSAHPLVVIHGSLASNTGDMRGIVGWVSPNTKRGHVSTFDLDNGDELIVEMPE